MRRYLKGSAVRDQEVDGSNPFAPTIIPLSIQCVTSGLLLLQPAGNWVDWVQHRHCSPKVQNPGRLVLPLLFYTERPLSTSSSVRHAVIFEQNNFDIRIDHRLSDKDSLLRCAPGSFVALEILCGAVKEGVLAAQPRQPASEINCDCAGRIRCGRPRKARFRAGLRRASFRFPCIYPSC